MRLQIDSRQSGEITVLDLSGHLVMGHECQKLGERIKQSMADGNARILLNVEKVDFIDSSGLGELITSHTHVKRNGGALKIVPATDLLCDLLRATRLDKILEVYDTEADALASFDEAS